MKEIVLATTSPFKRELLGRLISNFESADSRVDENIIKSAHTNPVTISEKLSQAKASSLREKYPHASIIGSDQVVYLGEQLLGKPGTRQGNIETLKRLSGKTHHLTSAVTVLSPGLADLTFSETCTLTMRELEQDEIERYADRDKAFNCAGGYKIESLGISLFEKIDCEDLTTIIGLPLLRLSKELRKQGVNIP